MGHLLLYLHPRSAGWHSHFYYCRSCFKTFGIRAAANPAGLRLVLLSIQKNNPHYLRRLAAIRVFFISEMMVIGPTPPGTGVM